MRKVLALASIVFVFSVAVPLTADTQQQQQGIPLTFEGWRARTRPLWVAVFPDARWHQEGVDGSVAVLEGNPHGAFEFEASFMGRLKLTEPVRLLVSRRAGSRMNLWVLITRRSDDERFGLDLNFTRQASIELLPERYKVELWARPTIFRAPGYDLPFPIGDRTEVTIEIDP